MNVELSDSAVIDRIVAAVGPIDKEAISFDVREGAEALVREHRQSQSCSRPTGGVKRIIRNEIRQDTFRWLATKGEDSQAALVVHLMQQVSKEADLGNI
jgi:hypothetical protein